MKEVNYKLGQLSHIQQPTPKLKPQVQPSLSYTEVQPLLEDTRIFFIPDSRSGRTP